MGEAGNEHQRPSNQHAVRVPLAVVEHGLADSGVALHAVVVAPQIVSSFFNFAVDGIATEVECPGDEQQEVQQTNGHRNDTDFSSDSQGRIRHTAFRVLADGLPDVSRTSVFGPVSHKNGLGGIGSGFQQLDQLTLSGVSVEKVL